MEEYPILAQEELLAKLKNYSAEELSALCEEIRRFLIDKVTKNGGHLASNLGVVELTVAMHRVFDSPRDKFVFDVGHQSYVHKILTGRANKFDELRRAGGLSGFPSPAESEHDAFAAGHSSTSLSAALGFAEANAIKGSDAYTVVLVGDGAMTGGMIHEALNNCKRSLRMIILLNDNGMSISRNTGRFARYLSRIRTTASYRSTKRGTKNFLRKIPGIGPLMGRLISRVKGWIKRQVYSQNYFENLGILYLGPVDGHNEAQLERVLQEAKRTERTVLVHVRTKKGKGLAAAEKDPAAFHGVAAPKAECDEVEELSAPPRTSSFHEEAAKELIRLAKEDGDICVVTAAMGLGTSMDTFAGCYPDRFFDVGIAEEHAMTFAAGLAACGAKPYFAVYSTFLQRAYDNLLHDVALQRLPVRILVDRAGFATGDGATHHGIFDVAFASHIPGVSIWAPATFGTLRAMLDASLSADAPLIIRYPNADESALVRDAFYPDKDYENFGLRVCGDADASVCFITYGGAVLEVLSAASLLREKGVGVRILLAECLAPYDVLAEKVLAALPKRATVIFAEEGASGGAAFFLHEALRRRDPSFAEKYEYRARSIADGFAVPQFGEGYLAHAGLDAHSLADAAENA